MKKSPKVSIIMGIYNCASTLAESIDSILAQTYENWELVMCDDGSNDNTYEVAESYSKMYPNKIKVIKNNKNCGLTKTLNHCLRYINGVFVARQDGDDISLPTRIQKQVEFLINNPNYSIVSTGMYFFDENGRWGSVNNSEYPDSKDFLKGSPFAHGPSMARREVLESIGGYDENKIKLRVEDYDLWFRIYEKGFRGYNIQELLYEARDDRNAITRRKYRYRINEFYVKLVGFKKLNLPWYSFFYAIKPLVVGLVPKSIYKAVRTQKYNSSN